MEDTIFFGDFTLFGMSLKVEISDDCRIYSYLLDVFISLLVPEVVSYCESIIFVDQECSSDAEVEFIILKLSNQHQQTIIWVHRHFFGLDFFTSINSLLYETFLFELKSFTLVH